MICRIKYPILSLILLVFSHPSSAAPIIKQRVGTQVIPSQYIIVFKDNITTDSAATRLMSKFKGLNEIHRYRHALHGMAVKIPQRLLKLIATDPNIAYIEPDVRVSINAQTLPRGVNRINAELDPVANIDGIDDRVDADIAILDTGIDLDHPDLNVFRYTYCKVTGINVNCADNDAGANDVNSHGTHVAGIAAALDNTSSVVGVAPGARLWAIKVLEDDGTGSGSQIIAGVDYVTQYASDIEVANLSLTGGGSFQALDDAISNAVAAGVVFTLAAGNDSVDVSQVFPAGHPDAITVSAFEDYDGLAGGLSGDVEDDTFAWFSNYGAGVDIMAPGVAIRSTIPDGLVGGKNGTSMAAPHVAGAAALYMSQNPTASPATVKSALIDISDYAPCISNPDGSCGPQDPDGIQEPLLLLTCDDADRDGVCDAVDNCINDVNPSQLDTDLDSAGDVCDADDDNDGLLDTFEIDIGSNTLLVDSDGDSISDYDEVAFDGDVSTYNAATDLNPLSTDTDNDSLTDDIDPIPLTFNFNDGDLAPLGAPDGKINVADYQVAAKLALGEIIAGKLELSHGDVYPIGAPDGVINTADFLLIEQLIK